MNKRLRPEKSYRTRAIKKWLRTWRQKKAANMLETANRENCKQVARSFENTSRTSRHTRTHTHSVLCAAGSGRRLLGFQLHRATRKRREQKTSKPSRPSSSAPCQHPMLSRVHQCKHPRTDRSKQLYWAEEWGIETSHSRRRLVVQKEFSLHLGCQNELGCQKHCL